MPKKKGITQEARARLMLALRAYQQKNPQGCTVTKLDQELSWDSEKTQTTIDDLISSGMVFGDYRSQWTSSHPKGSRLMKSGGRLYKVSPWGMKFLERWKALAELSTATDHSYSEMVIDEEGPRGNGTAVKVTHQGTQYEFVLTAENESILRKTLGDDSNQWVGATFDAQAFHYPTEDGFRIIADSVKKPNK